VPLAPIDLVTSKTWSEVTWRAGAEWDVAPQSLVYVSVETGYKAGGFYFTSDNPTYNPEKLTAYTVGAKNRFFNNRLQLNLEGYYWKYKDQQISHLITDSAGEVVFATQNVGQATMKGLEIETQFLATDTTLLTADVDYLDAVYDNFVYNLPNFGTSPSTSCPATPVGPTYIVDCSGRAPPQSPRWSGNLGLQQTFELRNGGSVVADARTHYQSQTLTGLEFLAVEEQKASRPVRRLSPIWNIAAAVILLAAGIGIGIRVASPGHQEGQPGTVATATHHGDSTDALVFTLLQEESASQRIKAVNYAENMTSPDPKVIGALINTLDHDKNVNVRLTCLYSLTKFSDNLLVRDALVASLTRQTEPIVQIVLINLLTEMKEPKARRSFQEIISNEKSSKEVKNIAEKGLRTI